MPASTRTSVKAPRLCNAPTDLPPEAPELACTPAPPPTVPFSNSTQGVVAEAARAFMRVALAGTAAVTLRVDDVDSAEDNVEEDRLALCPELPGVVAVLGRGAVFEGNAPSVTRTSSTNKTVFSVTGAMRSDAAESLPPCTPLISTGVQSSPMVTRVPAIDGASSESPCSLTTTSVGALARSQTVAV